MEAIIYPSQVICTGGNGESLFISERSAHHENIRLTLNPLVGNDRGKEASLALRNHFTDGEITFTDITSLSDYKSFLDVLPSDAVLVIAGGDGTLNRFINDTDGLRIPDEIYYYAVGSGNDFLHDLGKKPGDAPCRITDHIKDLPIAEVNGTGF